MRRRWKDRPSAAASGFGGALARGGRYELTSHSGTVTATLAGNAGFEVEATSFSGSIRSDLPVGSSGDAERGRRRRSVRGVVATAAPSWS